MGNIDCLLQIAKSPVWDGDLISKEARNDFVKMGWVEQCQGYNIITLTGKQTIKALRLNEVPIVSAA